MLVVPLEKDIIQTIDGHHYRVISYTNFKDGGPAVYVRSKDIKTPILVYFFDIEEINKTRVEFQKGTKIFRALGKIDRKYQLPQPDDKVTILSDDISDSDEQDIIEVEGLKLRSKMLGINKGMFIKGIDDKYYRLIKILDIKRSLGGENFNRIDFLDYYKDYIGV